MSKAFTSEETEDDGPRGRPPPRAGEARPITPAGKRALEEELRALQAERARAASPDGDPALLRDARKEELQRREELLAALLATAVEVGPPADLSRVAFGCTVELEGEDGRRSQVTLVGPDETDPKAGRISAASPLGRALLGQQAGDEVELERPRGAELLRVLSIRG